jgi:aspartyl-tRNA(Asn)/glutamyl-tRNA(Gln) amidotransferase subunit A
MRPSEMTARALIHALQKKQLSAVEVITDHIARMDVWEKDHKLNAVLTRNDEQAIEQAKKIDERRANKQTLGFLAGVPVGVKDIISTKGLRTTCASRILENYIPPYDATAIRRLQQIDAISMGKLNMDEFAMGSSTENSAFGPTKNPWDLSRVPGGSSGGSTAAVAAGMMPLALGTDTGGSIRQPAALCGVVGMKPTYGRVSRYGLIAYASSLDQIGPIARTVEDCALLLQAIAGYDPLDSTSTPRGVPGYLHSLEQSVKGMIIGVPKECSLFDKELGPGISEAFAKALEALDSLGVKTEEISLPSLELALPTYYLLATAEASSNLSRYDGVRYGHRAANAENLMELYERSRAEGFGAEVKRRIMLGTYALSAGYYDAYYKKAQEVRAMITNEFEQAFSRVDLIATPTAPTTAFPLGAKVNDPLSMYLADIFTIPCNLAGLPGISVPMPYDDDTAGLPIGLQLLGKHFDEETLFAVAHNYEKVRDANRSADKLANKIAPLPTQNG